MKVIVAGSREITDASIVAQAIRDSGFNITILSSGTSAGVDSVAEALARQAGIPVERYVPDWDNLKKMAGPARQLEQLKTADAVICIWNGESRGTRNMQLLAVNKGKPIFLVNLMTGERLKLNYNKLPQPVA